jgi:predicted acetyltransferase
VKLRLRPLRLTDEQAFVAAHRAMAAEGFTFGLLYEPGMRWVSYVEQMERIRRGVDLPGNFVESTFLVADLDGELVGRASIRHSLGNDFLAREGGHIGYGVVAEHRRRGHATEILRQSLVVVRGLGVSRVLITCADHNTGSATVIERCGGSFESLVAGSENGEPTRRYWIE